MNGLARAMCFVSLLTTAAHASERGSDLVSVENLGCGHCHAGAPLPTWSGYLPALADMGRRYQPDYLLSYLEAPGRVRPHLLGARMPTFPLATSERVSLVKELVAQGGVPTPAAITAVVGALPLGQADAIDRGRGLVRNEYACVACHAVEGAGAALAPSLDGLNTRLRPEWVAPFLVDPAHWAPEGRMPGAIFKKTPGGYVGALPGRDATQDLGDVVAYLFRDGFSYQDAQLKVAKGMPSASGWIGALGCTGCHGARPGVAVKGPPMAEIGRRLTTSYLAKYLQRPTAVRPAGRRPGQGGRMPDFRLRTQEAARLARWIKAQGSGHALPAKAPKDRTLSAYMRTKAKRHLREKLDCVGCHAIDGEGGQLAPDLSLAGVRLEPDYLYSILVDPQAAAPGTIMPKPRFRPKPSVRELVYHWLRQARPVDDLKVEYLAPALRASETGSEGAALYGKYCAGCHGSTGKGDGVNAIFLSPRPTDHTDKRAMAKRPDDTLFDGIHVGGFVLNRSHRMPGFGGSLSTAQIRALVGHIRELCQCEQPDWAGDGR